jgi:hemolysin-activating ACP:hemolysin acyltransferase
MSKKKICRPSRFPLEQQFIAIQIQLGGIVSLWMDTKDHLLVLILHGYNYWTIIEALRKRQIKLCGWWYEEILK